MIYVPPTFHDRSSMREAARLRAVASTTAREAQAALVSAWDAQDRGDAIPEAEVELARLRVCEANDALHDAERAFVRAWKAIGSPLDALTE